MGLYNINNSALRDTLLGHKYIDYTELTKIDSTRAEKIPTRDASRPGSISEIIFHCTDAPHWSPEKLSNFFVEERKFPICGYHWYIMADHIYQMVSANIITYHAAPHNTKSISFSIDYFPTRDEPANIQLNKAVYGNAKNTAAFLSLKHKISPTQIFGHREKFLTGWNWKNTDQTEKVLRKICPGMKINLPTFRFEVTKIVQKTLNEFNQTHLAIDGIFGPKSKKIFNETTIVYV